MMTDNINNTHINASLEQEQNDSFNSNENQIIKDSNNLNVPNKREQCQDFLDNAEREELRPKGNVPNLRFPEFTGEWEKCRLGDVCSFFSGGTPTSSNKNYYMGCIPFMRSGELHKDRTELFISEEGLKVSAAKMVEVGDLLLALYGATSGDIAISQINGAINQAILCIRTQQNKKYLESLWQKHVDRILQTYLQGGQGNLSADIVKNISFSFTNEQEQEKIAAFLSLIDERISIQSKIIEKLESLIKGISRLYFLNRNGQGKWVKLGDICKITTGKLNANAMIENGAYPFFTCAEKPYRINHYAFDTEALLVSGNGANLGYINYYKGKFNAYQRTYVLYNFKEDIQYVRLSLIINLPKRIAVEQSISNTPYIVLSTLSNMKFIIPEKNSQQSITKLLLCLEKKLAADIELRINLNQFKEYFLRNMFI